MTDIQPILLSAITCNRVIFDKMSGMASIIDIVQTINAPRYPARHWQVVFFCEMTNGHGKTQAKIRLVDIEDDEKVIFQQEGLVEFKSVRQNVTLAMNLQGIVFPHPGQYCFQIFAGGKLLGERRITCRLVEPPKDGSTPPPGDN